ncbi:hypothetical protein FAM09_26095 [Niastella caeni]|uniref:Uncharacterized protein n=1 Tax=Niastella caeni TaxID=2569763 RepID=A0A4S8HH65_9BACT|nr:hypothetical protein [Niastella caeni]THU32924.1 hypothetical protein FAM09_26095 [Niastella caeni]
MLFERTISPLDFRQWLLLNKENKRIFILSITLILISFTWLKFKYPYPNFMPPDSYNYLETAYFNSYIGIWPIGYSKFLRFVSCFSKSHLILVLIQYILLQLSLLYFLFTFRYLISPGTWLFRILLFISLTNPLLPQIANSISSDNLFLTLSLLWLTQLLWIIHQPSIKLILLHTTIVLIAFTVRHNALFYPVISAIVIIFSNASKIHKWLGIGVMFTLLLSFISRTQYEYFVKTQTVQYSAFGGWQIAANALYGYAFADPISEKKIPVKFRKVHNIVNHHMDSLRHLTLRPDQEVGIYYMWDYKSPLRIFMEQQWPKDSTSFLKKWASMAPLYAKYGQYLIMQHPTQFCKNFIWSNIKNFYLPPSYFMGIYNMGGYTVEPIAMKWFGWKNKFIKKNTDSKYIIVANIFTLITPVINILYITSLLAFVALAGLKKCSPTCRKIIKYILIIWLSNSLFSILSAPIELRYELFQIIISLVCSVTFISYIIQKMIIIQHTNTDATTDNVVNNVNQIMS